MGNSNSEVIVAAVALVISVVALTATFMQVLQQYYASAQGYSQCNEKVMGDWAKSKSRRFTWDELRFEVRFESPVIFVSPPNNRSGPVPEAPISFLDGSQESLEATGSVNDMDLRKEYARRTIKERIHTADNERASWFILMYAVQRMESKSGEWQLKQYNSLGPPSAALSSRYRVPKEPPSLQESHTLTVAVQRKERSWDTMPSSVAKPYATTTMCHLIEMMAALGVYWKEFDRTHDRYRGEGNGFMILGERVSDLGLMFSFSVSGLCQFETNRVIPVDEVKQLCFGYVPTIYRETLDQRRVSSPNDEPLDIRTLSMAGRREIGQTLVLIGCNNTSVRYYLEDGKRTSHLFPISFEILGMLSRTFHIDNSSFTYIPNPTPDRWDSRSLSLVKMMEAYADHVDNALPGVARRNRTILRMIKTHLQVILDHHDVPTPVNRLLGLKALHIALDDVDEVLTAKSKEARTADAGRPSVQQSEKLADEVSQIVKQEKRREVVQDVLRSHFQGVLLMLNGDENRGPDSHLHPDRGSSSPSEWAHSVVSKARFEDMDMAGPDDRQHRFMDVYFESIRLRVVKRATESTEGRRMSMDRRTSIAPGSPGGRTQASASIRVDTASANADGLPESALIDDDDATAAMDEAEEQVSLADQDVTHDDIWCTLVFRMICWLMLHDFNMQDLQINKSELVGSRMPVYIA